MARMYSTPFLRWLLAGNLLALSLVSVQGQYKDDVGYTQLQAEFGAALPDGSNVSVSQVEAREPVVPGSPNPATDPYAPNPSNSEFTGVTFNYVSDPPTTSSSHATNVGRFFYGDSSSLSPGIGTVDTYAASGSGSDGWLFGDFLRAGESSQLPNVENRDIQNHSYIGGAVESSFSVEVLRRFDFAIQRDNFLATVGLPNDFNSAAPLMWNSYNALKVGLSDGTHLTGTTNTDGTGRVAPDIVAPNSSFTSYAAPLVASAGAVLIDKAKTDVTLSNAQNSMVTKAILMAGATKDESEFNGTWDKTDTRPLDETYGAGEVNIYNSYRILIAGESEASATSVVGNRGWDLGSTTGSDLLYFFKVEEGAMAKTFSIILTWNRQITPVDNSPPGPTSYSFDSQLANLDLRFYLAENFVLGPQLQASLSTVDNVEHIYLEWLAAGQYAVKVESNGDSGTGYGLAWEATVVPEPGSLVLLLFGSLLVFRRRVRAV